MIFVSKVFLIWSNSGVVRETFLYHGRFLPPLENASSLVIFLFFIFLHNERFSFFKSPLLQIKKEKKFPDVHPFDYLLLRSLPLTPLPSLPFPVTILTSSLFYLSILDANLSPIYLFSQSLSFFTTFSFLFNGACYSPFCKWYPFTLYI